MKSIWASLVAFNAEHGKVTAVIVALFVGLILGKLI